MPAQGGRVVLTTLYVKPDVKPWRELTVTMHGHEAALQWVGEPGSGDITATWTERPGACGSYRLRLTDDDFHEARSLRELFRLGDTLDERDPDPSGMRAVWPEVDPGRLRAIQDELEVGGNEELAWLLDPDETAQRAVEETLGVTVVAVHLLEESSGIQTYLVRDRTGHEERVSVYRPSLGAGELIWIVLRVDGSTTIESVDVREDGKTVVRGTAPANALVGGRVRRACPQEPACPPLAEFSYDRATLGGRYEVVVDDPDPRRPGAVDVVLHGRGAQAFRDWTAIWIPPGFQELDLTR